jgi:uncharacterized membrane protein YhaH (DUF805 family)
MSNPQYGDQQPGQYPQQGGQPGQYPQPGQPGGSTGAEPPRWAPWYGIGFPQAFVRVFQKYADFTGRASRSEYWWFVVWNIIIAVVLSIVGSLIDLATGSTMRMAADAQSDPTNLSSLIGSSFSAPGNWVSWVWSLIVLIPSWALGARRLHDTNRSGWWQLLTIIPLLGSIVLIILFASGSRPEGARFDRPRG